MRAKQNVEAERLGDIIVGAGLQPQDLVGIGIGRGQHDHRHRRALTAHLAADLAAVHVREADIENHDVDMALPDRGQCLLARADDTRRELVVEHQLVGQRLGERRIIVDEQDVLFRGHMVPYG